MGKKRLSREIINLRLEHTNIQMIDEYVTSKHKNIFRCSHDHTWSTTADSVIRGSKCPHCDGQARLSKEIINNRLTSSHRNILLIGDYKNNRVKTEFKCCDCGTVWQDSWAHVGSGRDCPECTNYGFNKTIKSWGYILKYPTFIKYGITNNLERRLIEHKRNGNYLVTLTRQFETGIEALRWENAIKNHIGGNFVSRGQCLNGFTETLPVDQIENIINLNSSI